MNALIPAWKKWIKIGLEEDSASFDWTARATKKSSGSQKTSASLIAKDTGIWAGSTGLRALELLSVEMGIPLTIQTFVKDGDTLSPKQKICEWTGDAEAIVVYERSFINLASYTSGIAT